MTPKISIIVPCYNQAQYLDECLQSILIQTYKNWECIIVNDGSPDNTEDVTIVWLKTDSRFKYVKIENSGVSNARNIGIEKAMGELILPLDADDKIGTEYIERVIDAYKVNGNLKLVYCKGEKFGIESGELNLNDFTIEELAINNMIFEASIFRKKDWESIGGYDCSMTDGIEDWEFWISLLKNGGDVKKLDYVGFFYRVKEVSRSTKLKEIGNSKLLEYMSVKHADFYVNQFGSFHLMNKTLRKSRRDYNNLIKSKKSVFNLFIKTFFGFELLKIK